MEEIYSSWVWNGTYSKQVAVVMVYQIEIKLKSICNIGFLPGFFAFYWSVFPRHPVID